jgi:hypothetical protein
MKDFKFSTLIIAHMAALLAAAGLLFQLGSQLLVWLAKGLWLAGSGLSRLLAKPVATETEQN